MDWITIYTTTNRVEVSYLQDLLEEEGIHSVATDQTDSMYKFGEIRLMTSSSDAQKAIQLIENNPFN